MSQMFRQRASRPSASIYDVEREFDSSIEADREFDYRQRVARDILYSDKSIADKLVAGVMTGALSHAEYEEMHYSSGYKTTKGLFGRGSTEEWNDKDIRRFSAWK